MKVSNPYLATTATFVAKYTARVIGLEYTTGARCLILLNRETLVPFKIRASGECSVTVYN